MSRIYNYCPRVHEVLLKDRPSETLDGLVVPLADLVERECACVLSGVDRQEIANIRKEDKMCIDGDEYFSRFHHGEHEVDVLIGVSEDSNEKVLVADCKIQMKGGASIANRANLPDVCENIFAKYCSAKKNVDPIVPITPMYVIFNHAVASVARRYLARCSLGSNAKCRLASCFRFRCLTIKDFRELVA